MKTNNKNKNKGLEKKSKELLKGYTPTDLLSTTPPKGGSGVTNNEPKKPEPNKAFGETIANLMKGLPEIKFGWVDDFPGNLEKECDNQYFTATIVTGKQIGRAHV